ncbi:hypothetical protein cand_016310 [Cryptosporidium andersoni]|uniref:Uncharacterized protein n=1 Tax=Cryptosporidium andersoni TaxID=117008 RepID=A0A1J4MTR8_9CRYT|nr:hypothetical protein cand_016310 [Cryptosporidium andersoni]
MKLLKGDVFVFLNIHFYLFGYFNVFTYCLDSSVLGNNNNKVYYERHYNISDLSISASDRSEHLREVIYEPSNVGLLINDKLKLVDLREFDNISIIGIQYLKVDNSIDYKQSILFNEKDSPIYLPYEGMYVSYNLSDFSKFIKRIVVMNLEIHLSLDNGNMTKVNMRKKGNVQLQKLSKINPNISILLIAGYFMNADDKLGNFVPIFKDNMTFSYENAHNYYAKYGITALRDYLTNSFNDWNSTLEMINVDKQLLTLLLLPSNETKVLFDNNGTHIILPKLLLEAIQTHEEAKEIGIGDTESKKSKTDSLKKATLINLIFLIVITCPIIIYIAGGYCEVGNKTS